jgi:cell wall-associated NlpC family hydrolase
MEKTFKYYLIFALLLFSFSTQINAQTENDSLAKISDTLKLSASKDSTFVPYQNSQQVDNIINYAKKFLGTPYRYSGTTPSGFDCSGFISYIFGNFGFSLTRSSYGMAEYGKTVKLDEIRPGDLMFFKGSSTKSTRVGHVAMVVEVTPDAIKFIHSSTSRGVVIDNFKTSKYYIPRYVTTKRLDYGITDDKKTEEKKTEEKK